MIVKRSPISLTYGTHRTYGFFLILILYFCSNSASAQTKFWIEFRDKGITANDFIRGNPIFEATRKSLSKECLLRRALALNENPLATISIEDAPVCPRYLDSLRALGIIPIIRVKWENAVSAWLTHSQMRSLKRLKFIRRICPIGHVNTLSIEPTTLVHGASMDRRLSMPMPLSDSACGYDPIIYEYGGSQSQLDRINVWPLHAMGFDGSGVRLGLLDVGCDLSVSSLDSTNVLFQYDYVFQDSNVANPQDEHGTETLSTAAGYLPDTLIGPAYHCSVMLAHTEDTRSERNIEEDNYAAALEDMEARGVEITSSSLGYFTFDSGQQSYTYADMNGHTAICTRAVERAAKLGVLVVTAMGNNGADSVYSHEQAPADADSILACGALDVNDSIANFSSRGPTYDGRIKPDVCAPGVNCWAQNSDGTFTGAADGTSFATPLISGACCLIKQAHPEATAQQIRDAVMVTGNNAARPDTAYGWGELNAYAAALELGTVMNLKNLWTDTAIHFCAGIASRYGIQSVALNYFGDSDINPQFASFTLAADSLIYDCTIPFAETGVHLYYRIAAMDGSSATTFLPRSGWNVLFVPQAGVRQLTAPSLQLTTFPNPCSSEFQLNAGEPGHWFLFDILGRVVLSGKSESEVTSPVNVSSLARGVYQIEFISPNGSTQTVPVIVAH